MEDQGNRFASGTSSANSSSKSYERMLLSNDQITCNICDITMNSSEQAVSHFSGKKHLARSMKLHVPETTNNFGATLNTESSSGSNVAEKILVDSISSLAIEEETDFNSAKTYHCLVCNADLNSLTQAKSHLVGIKHLSLCKNLNPLKRKLLEAPLRSSMEKQPKKIKQGFLSTATNKEQNYTDQYPTNVARSVHEHSFSFIKPPSKNLVRPEDGSLKHCHICKITFNSDSQANMHFNGKKHVAKAALYIKGTSHADSTPFHTMPHYDRNNSNYTDFEMDIEPSNNTNLYDTSWGTSTEKMHFAEDKLRTGLVHQSPSEQLAERTGKLLECQLCRLTVNSESQLNAHLTSKKHMALVDQKTKRSCGRGRGFMLNFLRQTLTGPGQDWPGKPFQPTSLAHDVTDACLFQPNPDGNPGICKPLEFPICFGNLKADSKTPSSQHRVTGTQFMSTRPPES